MGVSIGAISKPQFIECKGYVGDDPDTVCGHEYEVTAFPWGREGFKPGCYVRGKGGRTFDFCLNYGGFFAFLEELDWLVCSISAEQLPAKYRPGPRKPFVELLEMPDVNSGAGIGPRTCAKLYDDFVAFANTARKHFNETEDKKWMQRVYLDFRKLFKIGRDAGFVNFW